MIRRSSRSTRTGGYGTRTPRPRMPARRSSATFAKKAAQVRSGATAIKPGAWQSKDQMRESLRQAHRRPGTRSPIRRNPCPCCPHLPPQRTWRGRDRPKRIIRTGQGKSKLRPEEDRNAGERPRIPGSSSRPVPCPKRRRRRFGRGAARQESRAGWPADTRERGHCGNLEGNAQARSENIGDGAFPLELSSVQDRSPRRGRVRPVGDKAQRLAAGGQNLLARGVATCRHHQA